MIYQTTLKSVLVTPPAAAVNGASVTCASIDCSGFEYAVVRLLLGATDIALTALKLQESDDDSHYSDVPGLDYSVSPAALPSAASDNQIFSFDVDLRGRKRYLKPVITVGAGTSGAFVTVLADLGRAAHTPHDAATRGLAATVSA